MAKPELSVHINTAARRRAKEVSRCLVEDARGHPLMTQTALDNVMARVCDCTADQAHVFSRQQDRLDEGARRIRRVFPRLFREATHDPRYPAYCKEQDRRETVAHALEAAEDYKNKVKTFGQVLGSALHEVYFPLTGPHERTEALDRWAEQQNGALN